MPTEAVYHAAELPPMGSLWWQADPFSLFAPISSSSGCSPGCFE
jgi:hypothetical protein